MKRYAWTRSIDDEIWRGGPCDSIKECVEEALDEGYGLDDSIALGYVIDYEIDHDFSDEIVYRLSEDAFDIVGEASDGWLDYVKKEELEVLNDRVMEVVKQWLKEIKEEPAFYSIEPFNSGTLLELLENEKTKTKGGILNVV
jgi:hypothetical protein